MSDGGAVVAYSLAWATFGIVSGWIASRVSVDRLRHDSGPLRLRGFERGGRWYERRLRITRWKDRLPEAGGLFRDGGSKSTLPGLSRAGVVVLARESRRAEWVHWANVAFGFTFFLWRPWPIGVVMAIFGLVVHSPFIAVQRYNRARTVRILRNGPVPAGGRGQDRQRRTTRASSTARASIPPGSGRRWTV